MKQLYCVPVLILALLATIVVTACSDDAPAPTMPADISTADEQRPQNTPTPFAAQKMAAPSQEPPADSDCRVGQVLTPQDSCTYPGTTEEFRVDEAGVGHFLFFTAAGVISARNALINDQAYDFDARRQSDGSWIIEAVGAPSDSVKVSDLVVAAGETATAVPTPQGESATATATPARLHTATAYPTFTPTSSAPVATPTSVTAAARQPPPAVTPTLTPTQIPTFTPVPTASSTPAPAATATPVSEQTPTLARTPGVNSPPVVVADIPSQALTLRESVLIDASQSFGDPDGDPVGQYELILSNSSVVEGRVNSVTGELTLTGLAEGESWVTLTACDAQSCSTLGDLTFLLTVNPLPNRPPQAANPIAAQFVRIGEKISVSVSPAFWDFEGDSIVGYDFRLDNEGLATAAVSVPDGTITFHASQVGTTNVSVIACDAVGCGGSELALNFALTVEPPPNRRPEVTGSIDDQTVLIGESIALDVSAMFSDPDDDIQEYGFSHTDRSVASVSIDSGTGMLTLKGLQVGTTNVAVEASDGSLTSNRSDLTFVLNVKRPPGHPPTIAIRIPDHEVELHESINVNVSGAFYTPERYRVIRYDFLLKDREVAEDSKISRGGILTLNGSEEGKTWVSVRACNTLGCSQFTDLEFVLVVSDLEEVPNQEPRVVGSVPDRELTLGESETFDVSSAFMDPDDGDRIVDYEYEFSNPPIATGSTIFNTGILVLRGAQVGETTVSIIACDENEQCSRADDMSFKLTVKAAALAQR